ncbi:MAG: ABC transporter permease, partial [Alphaproteobacteria bacterium]
MKPLDAIRELGFRALGVVAHLGQLLLFLFSILRASLAPPWRPRRWLEEIWGQGVLSLVIICVSGLAVGMMLVLHGYNTLVRFCAEGSLCAVVFPT